MILDSALLGVVVGSLLSMSGTFLNQWFSMRKETEQWQRQQTAEESKRKRDMQKAEQARVHEVYHNCLSRLYLLMSISDNQHEVSRGECLGLYKDTLEWLSLLELHLDQVQDEASLNFHNMIDIFTGNPNDLKEMMLNEVKKAALLDRILSPNHVSLQEPKEDQKRVHLNLTDEFRRQMAIQGKELAKSHMFDCELSTLTASQREKLWDMHHPLTKCIPRTIHLSIPSFDPKTKKILLKGRRTWEANLDPTVSSPQEIFAAWELAYANALAQATQEESDSVV